MKNLKFRAKESDEEKSIAERTWVKGSLVEVNWHGLHQVFIVSANVEYFNHDCGELKVSDTTPVDEDTVCMSTGIKDRNGIEVFEGDILKMINTDEDDECWTTKVGKKGVVDYSTTDYDYTLLAWVDDFIEFEVIGNIYDNPELVP